MMRSTKLSIRNTQQLGLSVATHDRKPHYSGSKPNRGLISHDHRKPGEELSHDGTAVQGSQHGTQGSSHFLLLILNLPKLRHREVVSCSSSPTRKDLNSSPPASKPYPELKHWLSK